MASGPLWQGAVGRTRSGRLGRRVVLAAVTRRRGRGSGRVIQRPLAISPADSAIFHPAGTKLIPDYLVLVEYLSQLTLIQIRRHSYCQYPKWWPVYGSNWWIAPDSSGYSSASQTLINELKSHGLNLIVLKDGSNGKGKWAGWRVNRKKAQTAMIGIEENNRSDAYNGLLNMGMTNAMLI